MSALDTISRAIDAAPMLVEIGARVYRALATGSVDPHELAALRKVLGQDLASRTQLHIQNAKAHVELGG